MSKEKPNTAHKSGTARHFNPESRRIYIDMDDTLCDFVGHYHKIKTQFPELAYPQSLPGFFLDLEPLLGAIEAFDNLSRAPNTEVFILTAPSVLNPHSYTEKRLWIEAHLGLEAAYRLILSPNKGLLQGDFLIDDMSEGKGQEFFAGEHIHFGSARYPDWNSVLFHPDFGLFSE